MVGFRRKEISNPLCLGEQLKGRRVELNITLAEVAKKVCISKNYLEALEEGRYDELPGEVYLKNFLKVYTKFLNLDYKHLLECCQSEKKIYNKTKQHKVNDFKKPVERVSRFNFVATPKIIKGLIVVALAICCLAYLGIKVQGIMEPPFLIVHSPANNLNTSQNFIEINGEAGKEATLEINGQQVLANSDGFFKETVDLLPGVNSIEIKAKKRHGKEIAIYRQIIFINQEEDN